VSSTIVSDPDWWPHRYDPNRDAVHFIRAPRDDHRAAVFLTDENLPGATAPKPVNRQEAVAAVAHKAPMHFIFHSAFCCSTLLARAFDLPGISMGLKEPVILNDLVGWRMRGASPQQVLGVLGDALTLLSRPFSPGEAVIVKPSNLINAMAPKMLQMTPEAKALFLYAPLPDFLASIARKGMWGRLWVRDLMIKQLKDGMIHLGLQGEEYLALTDLQAAAVGWLAQHALFNTLVKQAGPARIKTLNSSRLTADPATAMAALVAHYGLAIDPAVLDELVSGPVFHRHSKSDVAFDATSREEERQTGAALHADELEKVMAWAEAVAKNAGLLMELPAPLF